MLIIYSMKKKEVVLDLIIAILVFWTWGRMMFKTSDTALTATGIRSLKYFTVQSNLLVGISCLINILYRNGKKPNWLQWLNVISLVGILVTFFTVIFFLGPVFGYQIMYMGVSFWFHLVIPVMYFIVYMFVYDKETIEDKYNYLVLLPVGLYGIFYVGNILINGIGEWPKSNDWYGFMMWGYPGLVAIFAVILCACLFMGKVVRKLKKRD